MKTNSYLKSLGILGTTTLLALAAAHAKPEDDQRKDNPSSQKADKPADKKDAKADQKDPQPGKQNAARNDERDKQGRPDPQAKQDAKQDRGPDNRNKPADSKNRKEDRQDQTADRQPDARRDQRPDDKRRGEFKSRFEDRDREHVVTYFSQYKGKDRGLPPGLARKWEGGRRLPDGWRTRLVTGYVIEDDWYPAFEPVPYSWFPGIVVIPDTRLYWYGDRVIRVYEPTREVVDVVIIPTIQIDL